MVNVGVMQILEHQDIKFVAILLAITAPILHLQLIQYLLLTRSLKALGKNLIPIIASMVQKVDVLGIVQLIIAIQMDARGPIWLAGLMQSDGAEHYRLL